ncbi:MAG: hypothetical protein GY743_16995, partial [Planctomycetaceae bacterium]|nr:hypothetical protein [Planctomycetaceae bacterium]
QITSPARDTTLTFANTIDVHGRASDSNFTSYSLDYRKSGDTVWVPLVSNATTPPGGTVLGQWQMGSLDGSVPPPSDGDYAIRLSVNDRAGNQTVSTIPVTLSLVGITNVKRNQDAIKPLLGEALEISFTISTGATVELIITPEQGGSAIRTISQAYDKAGAYSLGWDGKNSRGDYVDDEAYEYTLTATTSGGSMASYDPGTVTTPGFSLARDRVMNSDKNDYYQGSYTLAQAGRVTATLPNTRFLADRLALPAGEGTLTWDGRNDDGAPVYGSLLFNSSFFKGIATNAVIIDGMAPELSGTAPHVEIKSDPYRISHSYDQISRISYELDQDSYITFKVLPYGVYNETDNKAVTLIDNVRTGANVHTVQWNGYADNDPAAVLVSSEGVGMFWIEAVSVASGKSTVYRGSLQMYK